MNILDLVQAAGAIPPVAAPAPSNGPDIVVTPKPDRKIAEDDRVAPSEYTNPELIQRKGLFGVKGTLRDVLGAVGDAFLVGSGRQAIYRPVREQEKLGSAIYGYNQDPVGAIDRAAMVDPQAAIDLQQRYDQGRRIDAQLGAQKLAAQQKGRQVIGSWAHVVTPDNYHMARDKLQAYSDQNGLGYDFPQEYDKDFMGGVFAQGLSPDEIADNDRADRSARSQDEYRQGQLGVARARQAEDVRYHKDSVANRSKPVDHGPGATNVDAAVLQAVASGTANPAQQKYYDTRLAKGAGSGKKPSLLDSLRSGNPNIPPPPGGTIRKIK